MTQQTQSITNTFHNAGMDDETAERMREAMAYSGYSHADYQQTIQATQKAIAATRQPKGAFGG